MKKRHGSILDFDEKAPRPKLEDDKFVLVMHEDGLDHVLERWPPKTRGEFRECVEIAIEMQDHDGKVPASARFLNFRRWLRRRWRRWFRRG